jgi:hypothetical protein
MSNAGIHQFQGWLTNPETIRDRVQTEAEVMLYFARDRTPVALDVQSFPQTRAFLWEVARRLAAQDPQVSTDPVMVKAREVAPEMIREEWCTHDLVWSVAQYVADHLETGAVFTVYTEVGMDNGMLELDMGITKNMTAIEIARASCATFAYRVFLGAADDDLEED